MFMHIYLFHQLFGSFWPIPKGPVLDETIQRWSSLLYLYARYVQMNQAISQFSYPLRAHPVHTQNWTWNLRHVAWEDEFSWWSWHFVVSTTIQGTEVSTSIHDRLDAKSVKFQCDPCSKIVLLGVRGSTITNFIYNFYCWDSFQPSKYVWFIIALLTLLCSGHDWNTTNNVTYIRNSQVNTSRRHLVNLQKHLKRHFPYWPLPFAHQLRRCFVPFRGGCRLECRHLVTCLSL